MAMIPIRKISIYALAATALWGTSFPITKIILEEGTSPILLAFLRYFFASMFFIVLSFFIKDFFKIKIKHFIILGLFSVALPTILQNIGLQYTDAYITGFIQSTGPIYTLIFAYLLLEEKLTIYKIIGISLAMCGIYFVMSPSGGGNLYGNILVLISAISYSIGGIFAKKRLNEGYRPIQIIAFSSFFGTIYLMPSVALEKITLTATSIPYIFFLAIVTTGVAYLLWYNALKISEISKLTFFIFLIPLFSIMFAIILLHEEMKILTVLAGFLSVIGVLVAQKA